MESTPITITLISSSSNEAGILLCGLTGLYFLPRSLDIWFQPDALLLPVTKPYTYSYMEQTFRLIYHPYSSYLCCQPAPHSPKISDRPEASHHPDSPHQSNAPSDPDILAIACEACSLERGLFLLSHILTSASFQNHPLPAVLCITGCDAALKRGISVDLDLLEDVLQIPVVSCSLQVPSSLDDVKAAISYAYIHPPSYDCLDFSPKKLAAETLHSKKQRTKSSVLPAAGQPERISAGPAAGVIILFVLFTFLLSLTFAGARLLQPLFSCSLAWADRMISAGLAAAHFPALLQDLLLCGILRPLFCVISVMLPPLMIFLPLFSLLEETGLLPRAAFCADRCFSACGGCGMQCTAMMTGSCCRTAAVMECRRISSPREYLAAVLTASFLPCFGQLAMLLCLFPLLTAFGQGSPRCEAGCIPIHAAVDAVVCTAFLLFSAFVSFGILFLLSHTSLKQLPSAFLIELTPLRRPLICRLVLPAALNRLSFLLGRAAAFAAPFGLLIWILARVEISGSPLLAHCAALLTPPARLLGLDGTILTAFLLGMPANEIVLPLMAAAYSAQTPFLSVYSPEEIRGILLANGWTWQTVCSVILLTLFQCPCLSALSAVRQETGSIRHTAAAALLPALCGLSLCLLASCIRHFFF